VIAKVFYALSTSSSLNMGFYTEQRWKNWLKQVQESNYTIEEGRDGLGPEGIVFLNMEEDVILALCKITGTFQNGSTSFEEVQSAINEMENWIFSDVDTLEPDKEAMFQSVKTALFAAFGGAHMVIEGKAKSDDDIAALLLEADGSEQNGKDEEAFELACRGAGAAFCGARIKSDKVLDGLSGSLVANWADGIDTIQAVLEGGMDLSDESDDEGGK